MASAPCTNLCAHGDDVGELTVFYGPLDAVRSQDEADLRLTGLRLTGLRLTGPGP